MSDAQIETRAEQPYVAISAWVPMTGIAAIADRLGEVFAWLGARGLAPAGPPFFKYNVIDMERELQMEVGAPVAAPVEGDENIVAGVLPAGRYATAMHVGHPSTLVHATEQLLAWADKQGLQWDVAPSDKGDVWGSRLEIYLTDPSEEPDMDKWVTQLAFRLAD